MGRRRWSIPPTSRSSAAVEPGDLRFVPGATGGVGVATIQLADVVGVRTIGSSSSGSKLDAVADLGADPDDLRTAVTAIGTPDAVINRPGGAHTRLGLDVVCRGRRMVVCGRTAGPTSEIDVAGLFREHRHVVGNTMGIQADLERLVDLVATGDLTPWIDRTVPLAETATAFEAIQEREPLGKPVVTAGSANVSANRGVTPCGRPGRPSGARAHRR
jgi:NADPH:quinone reductase-like Zn-dependent oxidoreductase